MSDQLSLDDLRSDTAEAGSRARDAGIEGSVRSDPDGLEEAVQIIASYNPGEQITASDVRLQQRVGSPSVLGAAFRTAAKRGLIEPEGYATSLAASRHAGLERTWRRT